MKTIILFGLLGATMSAPLIPQQILSASNSNELLLNLNNAQLQALQLQNPFNSWIPPFSGILQQQQAQIPGLAPFSLSTLDQFARLLPNQITFPGQVSFPQGNRVGQLDPSQSQTPVQTQQGPNHAMPYVFSFKMPQEQAQMLQYYPVYMLLPWEQPQQTVPQPPPQTGQQKFEEQMPFYTEFGNIPQAEPVIPGGQQQLAFDTFLGTAPETAVMERRHDNASNIILGYLLPCC
ncbi:odontogenic ameloblast-associated protein isoform X2 [Sturnira hondurensis]|uniref:odontogenic ameloblast-associated protein isoform X2 n=1 Tax=Sturnira hondurensis TaxID=192404 RepID=UPI00187945F3|nr:odontogenic ameloblast-associated protein isoform X2 [Sturnira hondurensis]